MLDGGFNPNWATSAGTTALMMAVPNTEKMKLLLDRGADVNARAKTKYSTRMVAALYPQGTPAIRLQLDRGAQVRLPQGQGAPLYGVSAMFLAAFAGNAEIIPRLREAGDSADAVWTLETTTPLATMALVGNTSLARALLDAGVKVDRADDFGITVSAGLPSPIKWTWRGYIERGGDVNHVDKKGMTP